MRISFINRTLVTRSAALALITVCLTLSKAHAQSCCQIKEWVFGVELPPIGIANGQSARATLVSLVPTGPDGGDPVVIGASLILFDERGGAVAQSEKVEILTGKF